MTDRLPTLVTYRSATELRDAGIRYAYLKAGMHIGLIVAVVSAGLGQYLGYLGNPDNGHLPSVLMIVGMLFLGIAACCAKTAVFPHCPRLTLEELETMRDDMNLSPDIYRQTHDGVLHGSFEEHKAVTQTDVILKQIKRAASGQ